MNCQIEKELGTFAEAVHDELMLRLQHADVESLYKHLEARCERDEASLTLTLFRLVRHHVRKITTPL